MRLTCAAPLFVSSSLSLSNLGVVVQRENHNHRISSVFAISTSALLGALSAPIIPCVKAQDSHAEAETFRHDLNIIPPSCSFDLESGRIVGDSAPIQSIPDSQFPPFNLAQLHSGATAEDADLVWHCFSHEFEQDGDPVSYEIRGIELAAGSRWALPIDGLIPRTRDEALQLRFNEGEIPFDVGGTPRFGGREFSAAEVSRLSFADRLQIDLYPLSFVPDHGTVIVQTAQGKVFSARLSVLPQHDQSKLAAEENNKPGYYLVIESHLLK